MVRLAREGAGPQLVVANLLRLCGHGEHDDAGYVDPRLKASPVGRDCVEFAAVQLAEHGWGDAATFAAWREESSRITDRAIAQVQREASPDPYNQDWCALSVRHLAEGAAAPEGAA